MFNCLGLIDSKSSMILEVDVVPASVRKIKLNTFNEKNISGGTTNTDYYAIEWSASMSLSV